MGVVRSHRLSPGSGSKEPYEAPDGVYSPGWRETSSAGEVISPSHNAAIGPCPGPFSSFPSNLYPLTAP